MERRCSDEIYALSVFKEHATFTSAITLAQQLVADSAGGGAEQQPGGEAPAVTTVAADGAADAAAADGGAEAAAIGGGDELAASSSGGVSQQQVDTYVHLIYGLSKDWCGSGLRVGVLYSRNAHLQQARRAGAACGRVACLLACLPLG